MPKTITAKNATKVRKTGQSQYMTGNQQAKIARMQQRTKRQAQNKRATNIKAAGSALSQVTTPFATMKATQTAAEQRTARERTRAEASNSDAALKQWLSLMNGNPDVEQGASGSTQNGSTGSILGG